MSNILDYIEWRGDLTFEVSPFNSIDALILAQLSYVKLEGIAPGSFKEKESISDLYQEYLAAPDLEKRQDTGLLINPLTQVLLKALAKSARFGQIKICGWFTKYEQNCEEQFSAFTAFIDKKEIFVAFRGTDDTLIGWKEDFNLAFMESVPAQDDALIYLTEAAKQTGAKKISVGGHSKGGNLALFAAANLCPKFSKRLSAVYNFDGPGFSKKKLLSDQFCKIKNLTKSFYPQLSIVGMLFEHFPEYSIVESDQSGLMQHDPFSWQIIGKAFCTKDEFDGISSYFYKTVNEWMTELSQGQREEFVESLFSVIMSSGKTTNSGLAADILKSGGRMIKAAGSLDKKSKSSVADAVKSLLSIAGENLKIELERKDKKKPRKIQEKD